MGEHPVWNALFEGSINADIVIYGSSRAWVHVNPKIISEKLNAKTFNLGIDGHNFFLQQLRHKEYLKYNTKPKLILHSLDVFTFEKRKDLYNSDQFLPYFFNNKDVVEYIETYNGFKYYDFHIPLLRYHGKYDAIKSALNMFVFPDNNLVERVNGYKGQDRNWNSDFNNAKTTIKKYTAILDSASINMFENYLIECKSNQIEVIFVYTPEYIEGQQFISNRTEIMHLYHYFSQKYGIKFYDFSNNPISFNKDYFYNAMHMNKTGSDLFTNNLVDSLLHYENLNHILK